MTDITIDRSVAKQAERDAAVVRKLKSTSAVVLLLLAATSFAAGVPGLLDAGRWARLGETIGRASCRERVYPRV